MASGRFNEQLFNARDFNAGPDVTITLTAPAVITLAGQVPSVSQSVSAAQGLVTAQGQAPSVEERFSADVGLVTASGQAPALRSDLEASAGQITVQGQDPTLQGDVSVEVDVAVITVSGQAPTVVGAAPPVEFGVVARPLPRRVRIEVEPAFIFVRPHSPAVFASVPSQTATVDLEIADEEELLALA